MSIYSFKITKGKFQLSLSTDDKEFVASELEKWVRKTSDYVQKQKINQCKTRVSEQISAEEEITRKNISEQLKRHEAVAPRSIEREMVDSNARNLDIFYAPNVANEAQKEIANTEPEPGENVSTAVNNALPFDNILDKSMQNPQTELTFKPSPSIKKDNAFLNYLSSRKVEKNIDYLLLTAYYFAQYEQKPRFTLKQLNAKLMQNIAVIIDHAVLQEAINRDYIECLPDLTGLVGASEYRLTAYGEKVLLDA